MTSQRRLAINADDLGLSDGVNRGIMACADSGVVTSASLLVNTPAFAAAVAAALGAPRLSVGLHLNLTTGAPVSHPEALPTLCDPRSGRFRPLAQLVVRSLTGRVKAADVAKECAAQVERARAAGVRLTHLDGHQHTHVLPGIWQPVVATARDAGIDLVRLPLEPASTLTWRPAAAVGQVLLAASYRLAARRTPSPRHVDHFRGFALTGRRDFTARLLALLDRLEPGVTELMVHPGYPDAALRGWVGYTAGRERELEGLLSPAVRGRLAEGDIVLVPLGDPWGPRQARF
jgi:predicted glycoside hydrolase/deacetylase ChbG (UPF0249 family)